MKNFCSKPVALSRVPSLALLAVWDVDEGPAYDSRRSDEKRDGLIAIRTLKGMGRVGLADGREIELRAGSFIVLSYRAIRRYHTVGRQWKFWWFEFTAMGVGTFPLAVVMDAPWRAADARDFRTIFAMLRRPSAAQRALAVALFSALLHRWLEQAPGDAPRSRHEEVVARIIDRMSDRLGEGWQIREMARAANMSERAFRNAFQTATGLSPKAFYDRTRLAFAEELLKLGTHTVSEIAGRLGYSSPFHFSRAFKQRYGVPPVRWRRKRKAEG
jgi:AraC-like DNA-binding protein